MHPWPKNSSALNAISMKTAAPAKNIAFFARECTRFGSAATGHTTAAIVARPATSRRNIDRRSDLKNLDVFLNETGLPASEGSHSGILEQAFRGRPMGTPNSSSSGLNVFAGGTRNPCPPAKSRLQWLFSFLLADLHSSAHQAANFVAVRFFES